MITHKLKEDLTKFSKGFPRACFLEIGFQKGSTIAEMSGIFDSLYGVDKESDNFSNASTLLSEGKVKNAMLFCGDASRIPINRYDVILINPDTYDNLAFNTLSVLGKNINEKPFLIVYYGYGLLEADVRKFCDENFGSFMVPVGEETAWNTEAIDGHEAVACAFNMPMKKKFFNSLKKKIADPNLKRKAGNAQHMP